MPGTPQLVGLTGYAQTGKSTAADYLNGVHGFTEVNFADALRDLATKVDPILPGGVHYRDAESLLGYEEAKGTVTGFRQTLKDLGSGCREVLGEDVWIRAAMRRIPLSQRTVVADCRFLNEAAAIRNHNPRNPGVIIRIVRPDYGPESNFEREVDLIKSDYTIVNDGCILTFYDRLGMALRDLAGYQDMQQEFPFTSGYLQAG